MKKHARRLVLGCIVIGSILAFGTPPSSAQTHDGALRARAESSFRAGAAAYAAGEYQAAIQAFEAAHGLTPLPAITFSLAQAERRQYFVTHESRHLERALALFRAYLAEVSSAGRRADAVDALAQLESLAATQRAPSETSDAKQPTPVATRLLIASDAPGARIALDDGESAHSPLIREVTPGKHVARAEAEGFFPAQRELTALPGELVLGELPLRERPSVLMLATPSDADVYIDGAFVAQGGPAVRLELPAGSHRLAVTAKGARVAYRSVTLVRGQTHTLRIALSHTALRTGARALFGAGGGMLAASIIVGGMAIHAEGKAQDFLARRERANVSAAALTRYHQHVEDRGVYRTLGIASMGAGAALLTAALLIRELDRTSPRDIQRDARSVAPSSLSDASSVRSKRWPSATPWLGHTVLGAALHHTF